MYLLRFDMRAPGKAAPERAALYRAAVEMAAWADDRDCSSIVISEHHASDDGYLPAPNLLAAAMAGVTSSVTIAIAASLLPLHDPVHLAEEMIVLDHLSEGRVVHTMGLGYRELEYQIFGVDFARRGAVADEKLTVLLSHLRGQASGPQLTPPPFTPGGPFLSWGGGSPAAARRAGRFGLSFIAQTDLPGLEEAYVEAARAAGHEPGLCILASPSVPRSVFVNDDIDAGWDEVGPSLLADATSYAEWNRAAGVVETTASLSQGNTVDELRAENASHRVVTVDQAVGLIQAHGSLSLQPLCGGLDPEIAWRYLRRVTDEVLPRVRGTAPPEARIAERDR